MHRVAALLVVSVVYLAVCSVWAAADEPANLNNLAAASTGAKAWSDGDMTDKNQGVTLSADLAIDGVRTWYNANAEGKVVGKGWMTDKEGRVSQQTPATWGVRFPNPLRVNRVRIYHIGTGNQLVDFAIEYKDPEKDNYRLLTPVGSQWMNPVTNNQALVNDLRFDTVSTQELRIVITRAAPDVFRRKASEGGTAYIAEFEAYFEPDELREAAAAARRSALERISSATADWLRQQQRSEEREKSSQSDGENRPDEQLSPALAWLRTEKFRGTHTPLATDKLLQYADAFRDAGLNAHMLANWHWDARAEMLEPDLVRLNQMAADKGFHLLLWTAWYWYPDDDHFTDRNALAYLGKEYRGTVDFFGTELFPTPCPFAEEFWDSIRNQAVQAAKWSTEPHLRQVQGFVLDFEHYGAQNGRGYDTYNYDKCFCDDCFGRFLDAVGVKLELAEIPDNERYSLLNESGAREAYYQLLTERAREHARDLRERVHAINPDFLLGFYGIWPSLGVFERSLDDLPEDRYLASWFGEALLRELGTPRMPMIYVPLVTDPAKAPFYSKRRELQDYIRDQKLSVLYCPGYVICPEQPSQFMQGAISESLLDHDGFWMNELWMFWAYQENPQKPTPSWFVSENARMEAIENYWEAMRGAIRRWHSSQ